MLIIAIAEYHNDEAIVSQMTISVMHKCFTVISSGLLLREFCSSEGFVNAV